VTAISCASSSSIKEKEIQKKRNIKSRKIDKRKRKILVSKAFHNIDLLYRGLVTLLGWPLSRIAPGELITTFILF